ncbi:hypothetical protein JOM56_015635, partial [Amanita muscaria]
MPNVVGPWIPRAGKHEDQQFYSCVMLALLKPWRTLGDLLADSSTWAESFEKFLQQPTSCFARRFTENAQFFYDCKEASSNGDKSLEPGTGIAEKGDVGYRSESESEDDEDPEI